MSTKILIVEDERITAEDIHDTLVQLGYEVVGMASSSAEAIRQAEQFSPDLALMDIRIKGDTDGIETAKILRQRFDIPVVYLTAHADIETLQRAKDAEPLGYIVKPFQEPELRASIEVALHKQLMDRQSREKGRWFLATLQAIGEGVITVDSSERVLLMNPAAEAWTGWRQPDALGKPIEQVFRLKSEGSDSNPAKRALEAAALAEFASPSVLVAKNGMSRQVGGTAAPMRDHRGRITGAVLVFGDATESGSSQPSSELIADRRSAGSVEIIAESPAMRQVTNFAARVAASEVSTILIEGESGSGKDVIARFIHANSRRQQGPFLAINCAAIPETLLESELFGYEKGAFTDARSQKMGILEVATGGTVFLDEIGELSMPLQAKLLRVLEEYTFRRLGGTKDIQIDVRVITATNRDLREAVQQGKFRLDLYYRLNVIALTAPPLRQHKEDIIPLANHFIQGFNAKFKKNLKGVSPEAAAELTHHDWPGNIRELRNTIERAMVLEDSPWVQPSSLAIRTDPLLDPPSPATSVMEGRSLEDVEKAMLIRALEEAKWNQTRAARALEITRDTLRYKMKKFNLFRDAANPES